MQILRDEAVYLTPLVADDALRLYVPLCDPALYFFVPVDPPATLGQLKERFERLEQRVSPDGREHWLNWVVGCPGEDEPVGLVEVTLTNDGHAVLGYFILRPFWGRGLATAALRLVVNHLTQELGVKLLSAHVDTRNAASLRVLDKLGFNIGEFIPQADFFKGTRSDEYRLVRVVA